MQALARLLQNYMSHAPKCLFHLVTGYYCPGCGGVTTPYRDDTINPDARQADDE